MWICTSARSIERCSVHELLDVVRHADEHDRRVRQLVGQPP
jgi:hypothetical protein